VNHSIGGSKLSFASAFASISVPGVCIDVFMILPLLLFVGRSFFVLTVLLDIHASNVNKGRIINTSMQTPGTDIEAKADAKDNLEPPME
jgi:hypothetical protein